MESAVTAPKEQMIDLWDWTGAFWYRPMPEETIHQFASGEMGTMTITEEGGEFWLNDQRYAGQSSYPTLAQAKAAGDAAVEEAFVSRDARIVAAAELDAAVWALKSVDQYAWFERIDNGGVRIEPKGPAEWIALDDEEELGSAGTAKAAALIASPEASPRA